MCIGGLTWHPCRMLANFLAVISKSRIDQNGVPRFWIFFYTLIEWKYGQVFSIWLIWSPHQTWIFQRIRFHIPKLVWSWEADESLGSNGRDESPNSGLNNLRWRKPFRARLNKVSGTICEKIDFFTNFTPQCEQAHEPNGWSQASFLVGGVISSHGE